MLAKAMLARGDRANAERLVRDAWRSDPMSEDTENNALDQFGALLTPGDQKARMDTLLYGSEKERRAARCEASRGRLCRTRQGPHRLPQEGANCAALLEAVPRELHGDPGFIFSKIQLLRREEKFAEAAQLMLSAPKDPSRLYNLDEWWIERRLLARKMIDTGEFRSAYLIARDAALPSRDIYKTEQEFTAGWIALRFLNDPATATQHFARIGVGSVNPTALARAGYWQGRAAEAAGRKQEARTRLRAGGRAIHQLLRPARTRQARPAADRTERRRRAAAAPNGWRSCAPRSCSTRSTSARSRSRCSPTWARTAIPTRLPGLANSPRATATRAACCCSARPRSIADCRSISMPIPSTAFRQFTPIGPEVERSIVYAIARQESAFNPSVVSPAQAYGLMQVTPDAGRYVCKRHGATYDLERLKNDPAYNATLGAAELGGLLEDYRGSYIMTFAAYNAGRGSVKNGSSATAIRAIPRSTRSTGSS